MMHNDIDREINFWFVLFLILHNMINEREMCKIL